MDEPQHLVAILDRIDEDAHRADVVDRLDAAWLAAHLAPDAVDVLRPAADFGFDSGALELIAQNRDDVVDVALAVLTPLIEQLGYFLVLGRFERAQGEIFELPFQLPDAQSIGERREHVLDLACRLLPQALVRIHQIAQRLRALGELDQHHADVVDHGKQHLAQVFRLRRWSSPAPVPACARSIPRVTPAMSVVTSAPKMWSSAELPATGKEKRAATIESRSASARRGSWRRRRRDRSRTRRPASAHAAFSRAKVARTTHVGSVVCRSEGFEPDRAARRGGRGAACARRPSANYTRHASTQWGDPWFFG